MTIENLLVLAFLIVPIAVAVIEIAQELVAYFVWLARLILLPFP